MRLTYSGGPSLAEAVEGLGELKRKYPLRKGGTVATTLFAHQIGARACATILDPDRTWSVLASVSGAIYIESDVGEILWIAAHPSALHSRATLLAGMPAELPPIGTECFLEDDCLHVGLNFVIRLYDAEFWCPEVLRLRNHEDAPDAALRIIAAIDQAALLSPPQGLLASIVVPHALRGGRGSFNAVDEELVATASRGIEVLCQATTEFNLPSRLQEAIQLVGLGRGLTPSGDDLLGGFLYTLHALCPPCSRSLNLDWEGVDGWLSQIRMLTNKISFAILADLARADAAALLHEFLNAVLDEQPLESLVQAAWRVSEIGQSSGWDMLAGVYCACSVVERLAEHQPTLVASSN